MQQTLADLRRVFAENDWRAIAARVMSRDTHPIIQFIKYGVCGVAAALAHNLTVLLVATLWLPTAKGMLVDGVVLDEATRVVNLRLANLIAFPVGALVAYVTNVLWVFSRGRHSRRRELVLFVLVSALSFFPCLYSVDWFAGRLGWSSTATQLGFIFVSVCVNFICRKLFIFQK